MCLTSLILYRKRPGLIRSVFYSLSFFALLASPWFFYAKIWQQLDHVGHSHLSRYAFNHIYEVNFHIVPLILLAIPVIVYGVNRFKKQTLPADRASHEIELLLWVLIPCHIIVLALVKETFFRYLTPLIPALFVLSSIIVYNYFKPRVLRLGVILLLCLSNALSVVFVDPMQKRHRIEVPFAKFIAEIALDYTDRLEDIVIFFRKNGSKEDTVLSFDPEFPLIFYTDMRVVDALLTKGEIEGELPDWILSESASGILEQEPKILPDSLKGSYEEVVLRVHDTPRHASRPSPDRHVSFTAPKLTDLIIYKKR